MNEEQQRETQTDCLSVVGSCPQCGAAIYGRAFIALGDKPTIAYGCNCWRKESAITQQMLTK